MENFIGMVVRVLFTVIVCVSTFALSGCEHATHVDISLADTLEFRPHGDGKLVYVTIFAPDYASKAKTFLDRDLAIWRLEYVGPGPGQVLSGRSVPHGFLLAYGKVPFGFRQTIPAAGSPPKIEEGKKYYTAFETVDADSKFGYFMMSGHSVAWVDSSEGPCFAGQPLKRVPCTKS